MIKIYLIGAALASVVALVAYQRWDAARDYRLRLEAERIEHIETAREIENEVRDIDDTGLVNCLRGVGC